MANLTIVQGEDWIGLYVADRLAAEGHSLDVGSVLRALGLQYDYIPAEQYLWDTGRLPFKLQDVVPDGA